MTAWIVVFLWATLVAVLFRTGTGVPGNVSFETASFLPITRTRQARMRGVTATLTVFAMTPLVFLLAVRQDVGTDYASYVEIYERLGSGESLHRIEPLYVALNQSLFLLGSSGLILVFAISAAFSALPFFYRVFRSSPMPWLGGVILFGLSFPFFMTNAVRSSIAIGIIMLVFPALGRRSLVIWSLGVVLASGFHFTALMVWPFYWILHLAWPKSIAFLGLGGAVLLSTQREVALSFLQFSPAVLPSKYAHYPSLVLERLGSYEFGLGYLIYIALAGLVILVWGRAVCQEREILVYRNAAFLGLILCVGLYQFWAVNRIGLYFIPALAVFLPWIITCCVAARERVMWAGSLALLFGAMFARGLWVGAHHAVPYQWIF